MRYDELAETATDPDYDLKGKYAHYNKLLFDGKLPDIPIVWKVMKTSGGVVRYHATRTSRPEPNCRKVRLGLEDKYSNYDLASMKMTISPLYKKSEQALDDILIHEMIHVYFLTHDRIGEGHGPNFERERLRCSKIVGFEVTRKDSVDKLEFANEIPIKSYGVVVIAMKNGQFAYALMSPAMLRNNLDMLKDKFAPAPKTLNASVLFYLIADKIWSEKAMRVQLPRKLDNLGMRKGIDPKLFADLQHNGTLIDRID